MRQSLCFVGDPGQEKLEMLNVMKQAGLESRRVEPGENIFDQLEQDPPLALVLSSKINNRNELIASFHERRALSHVPVVAQVPALDPDLIEQVLLDGADDFFIDGSRAQFTVLTEILQESKPSEETRAPSGLVLIADQDRLERVRLGRVFKRNGFDVHFASDTQELKHGLDKHSFRAVLASATLPGESFWDVLINTTTKKDEPIPWIVMKTAQAAGDISSQISSIKKPLPNTVFDESADSDRLTFLMNEVFS